MNNKIDQYSLRAKDKSLLAHGAIKMVRPQQDEALLHEFRVNQLELKMENQALRDQLKVSQLEMEMQSVALRSADFSLRESRDRYVDLYDFVPDGYLTLNRDGLIDEINLTGAVLLGVERDKLRTRRFATFVAAEDQDRWHLHFSNVLKHDDTKICELELLVGDGGRLYVQMDCLRLSVAGQTPFVRIMVTNITKRKAAEQQQRDLTAHLHTVREDEKASIAREIHDELGGTMTALKIQIHQLKTDLSLNANSIIFLGQVESMSQLINSAAGITRNIISDLRPAVLDDLGLLAAIEWQAGQFHKLTGIEYLVNCIGDKGNLDNLHSIALFRILQEALTNVTRHSGASRVEIEFHHGNEDVMLSVSDNGRGMAQDRAANSVSYGMLGMKERVEQLGGTIRFDVPPGGGVCLMVIFSLPAKDRSTGWKV
jgi:PAS domain S-box-containing protein